MYRLFAHLGKGNIRLGNVKAYSNLYFSPHDFADFQAVSHVKVNAKDQDFAIYKSVTINVSDTPDATETIETSVPVVAFECKTYLDKTMLEGSIATAEKIKNGNPHCRFCIVTRFYDIDKEVDVKHSRIDQIYVLNKAARRKGPPSQICGDVVRRLYQDTLAHLTAKWSDVENNIRDNGIVL